MKYYTIIALVIAPLISIKTNAQVNEIAISFIGINNINRLTDDGDNNDLLNHFWSPEMFISGEYTTSIFRPDILLHTGISAVGISSTVSFEYNDPQCAGCSNKRSSSFGTKDLGVQLGLGKRFHIGKEKSFDLIGGVLMRLIFNNGSGSSGGCGEQLCFHFRNDEYPTGKNIHPSLYTKASWILLSNKKMSFNIRFAVMYAHGLSSVYHSYSKVHLVQENITYNYVLENRGSFFGAGLSFGLKRSVVERLWSNF